MHVDEENVGSGLDCSCWQPLKTILWASVLKNAFIESSFSIAGSMLGYGPTVSKQYILLSSLRTRGHIRFIKSCDVINDSIQFSS